MMEEEDPEEPMQIDIIMGGGGGGGGGAAAAGGIGGGGGFDQEDMNENNDNYDVIDPPPDDNYIPIPPNGGRGGGGGGGVGGLILEELQEDANFIVENPSLDLESYANSYTGMAKLFRLIHIGDHCPPLKMEALKMALAHVTQTYSVEMYQLLHRKIRGQNPILLGNLNIPLVVPPPSPAIPVPGGIQGSSGSGSGSVANGGAAGGNEAVAAVVNPTNGSSSSTPSGGGGGGTDGGGIPPLDTHWMESTCKKSALKMDKLDAELKNHKSNSIKESIRRGYDDLGEYYLECGDLMNALKSFTRSRDYCTSAKHVVNMCLNIIKVSIYLQNWAHVNNYVLKAENTPDPSDDKKVNAKESGIISAKLRCAMGLSDLALKKYKTAARCFLQINFDSFECPELISQSNVAVYASLCALATFNRKEMQEEIISSSSFKLFLEVEPSIRDVIYSFYESKYGKCLQLLDEIRDNLMLDLYLAPHVRTLYSQIRSRGLIQYFAPYASADLVRMASSFNTSVAGLENELMNLILGGQITARIDSHNKVLLEKRDDERAGIFEKVLTLGNEYERKTKLGILRTAMLRAHLQVKNPLKEEQEGPGRGGGRAHQFNNHV